MYTISDSQRAWVRKHGTLVARILIGALFVFAGVAKISTFAMIAGYIGSVGLPFPSLLAAIAVVIEVGAGLALIAGWHIGAASALLAAFTLIVTMIFHHPGYWEADPSQQTMFLKDLAMAGGLIYVFAYGPGDGWALRERTTIRY